VALWFNADHQGRGGDTVICDCAQQGRVASAVMHGRTVTNVTGAYSNSRPTWRHVAKAPAETMRRLAQTAASGMVPWLHWLGGAPEDTRWKVVGRDFFTWLAANEAHFRNRRSIADITVLYPKRTIAFYRSGNGPRAWRGSERAETTEYLQGLYLRAARRPDPVRFSSTKTISWPETLSVRCCSRTRRTSRTNMRAYSRVRARGGSLLATFETSRYEPSSAWPAAGESTRSARCERRGSCRSRRMPRSCGSRCRQ
jgi:hypothetical protein